MVHIVFYKMFTLGRGIYRIVTEGERLECEVQKFTGRRNNDNIESQLVWQCAPLIAGLRISSLFIIHRRDLRYLYGLLRGSRICYYVLYVTAERVVILLYHVQRLTVYLEREEISRFLADRGYPVFRLEDILGTLRQRYQDYYRRQREFPHEMGLLLGYPLEDVKGFIHYKGKHCLYAGYWKVYDDVKGKRELFGMFGLAREMLAELLQNGADIQDIIENYSGNEWT